MPTATIDEFFAQTLKGDYDNDKAWHAIHSLRATGSREVFDKAVAWCRSNEPLKRARGADILAQFGHTADNQTTLFADESFPVLAAMLDSETDPVALSAIITAFGHLDNRSIIPRILPFSYHSDADVRYGLAFTLGCFADDERTVSTLIKLMSDKDSEVRDWATFGLGGLGNFDSPKIREALFKNLSDEDEDVCEEALVGLARRKDPLRARGRQCSQRQGPRRTSRRSRQLPPRPHHRAPRRPFQMPRSPAPALPRSELISIPT
jgi:HEAT repeat protein